MPSRKRAHTMLFYLSIALVVLSTILYHLFQKATPDSVHPLIGLAITYATATGVCLVLLPLYPLQGSLTASLREVNWASIALGLAVVGIEAGFLLAYRAGWNLNAGALIANVAVSIALIPLGALLFAERFSPVQMLGVGVCVVGLLLVNWR